MIFFTFLWGRDHSHCTDEAQWGKVTCPWPHRWDRNPFITWHAFFEMGKDNTICRVLWKWSKRGAPWLTHAHLLCFWEHRLHLLHLHISRAQCILVHGLLGMNVNWMWEDSQSTLPPTVTMCWHILGHGMLDFDWTPVLGNQYFIQKRVSCGRWFLFLLSRNLLPCHCGDC